jgi:cholest-4-en-3-one 26-monooxygenase
MEQSDEEIAKQQLMLINMDPPKHNLYRRISRNAFTPSAVNSYEPRFRRYAKEIVDRVSKKGECEFVEDVAKDLPLIAILELCGVPTEDRGKFFEWTNAMFFHTDPSISEGDGIEAAKEAGINIYLYAMDLAKQHAENPKSNIVGSLLDGKVNDEKLSVDEFCAFFLMLISAGNESTRTVTTHGMRLLIENPDQLQLLVDEPSLIPYFCEEVLRFNAAFMAMRRTAMEDVELAGEKIKKGDKVVLFWHGVNRDDRVFDNPMKFDIRRYTTMPDLYKQHRAFGIGQHFCLGSHLARLELNVIFDEVIPRLKNPRFGGDVQYIESYFVNGIKSMPIVFDVE